MAHSRLCDSFLAPPGQAQALTEEVALAPSVKGGKDCRIVASLSDKIQLSLSLVMCVVIHNEFHWRSFQYTILIFII
ncbi:hypothetical protein C0J52_03820 [Blattella germanica]|nr:hypothetical protein C0J52_03820 [Blattella germanica]